MSVRILQDHTDLMDRLVTYAADSPRGLPLSIPVLEMIRSRCAGAKYRGKLYTVGQLEDLQALAPDAEQRGIELAKASAVELEVEAWYCVTGRSVEALERHHVGPVVRWNGASWWAKLSGIEVPLEVQFDEEFTKRKRGSRSGAASDEKGAGGTAPPAYPGSTLCRPALPKPL